MRTPSSSLRHVYFPIGRVKRRVGATVLLVALLGASPCVSRAQGEGEENAKALYQKGVQLRGKKDYMGALQLMRDALLVAPGNSDCLGLAASLLRDMGRYEQSAQYAEQAMRANPKVAWYQATWAFANYCAGNLEVARPALEKLVTAGPQSVGEVNYKMAQAYLDALRDRNYTLTWTITPTPKMIRNGVITLPAPATGLPYQSATWEVVGAKSFKAGEESGLPVILVEPDGVMPFRFVVHATVRATSFHDALEKEARSGTDVTGELPAEVRPFLKLERRVNSGPKISDVAETVRAETPLATVRKTVWWLEKNMRYERGTFENAEEAITRGYGDCGAYSFVFASLCRANGIPARVVWGTTKTSVEFAEPGHMSGHVWAEFYLRGVGWVPVEPQTLRTIGFTGTGRVVFFRASEQRHSWSWTLNREAGTYTPAYEESPAE